MTTIIPAALWHTHLLIAQVGGKRPTTPTPSTPTTQPSQQSSYNTSASNLVTVTTGENIRLAGVTFGDNQDYIVIKYELSGFQYDEDVLITAFQYESPNQGGSRRKLEYVRGTGKGLFQTYGTDRIIAWNLRLDTASNRNSREWINQSKRAYIHLTAEDASGSGFFATVLFLGILGGLAALFVSTTSADEEANSIPNPPGIRPPGL